MFERYTPGAKRAVYFANIEAVHRNEPAISTRDLLAGLTWEADTRASRIAPLKTRAVDIRALLGIPHLPSTALQYRREAIIPLDGEAKKAIAYAAREADQDSEYWIHCDHLLRGLLRFPNGTSTSLDAIGVDLALITKASTQDRKVALPLPTPSSFKLKLIVRKYGIYIVTAILALLILIHLGTGWESH